jgi:anti-sigma-K factor RskA
MSAPFRSHDEIEALLSVEALDGLDDADAARLAELTAEHGPDCADCRELRAGFADAAAALASTLDPVPMSEGAEERLLAAARGATEQDDGVTRVPFATRRTTRAPRRWVAVVAVAAAVAVIAGAVGYAVAPRGSETQRAFAAFVSQPGTKVVVFPQHDGQHLAVAFRPGTSTAWVVGANLASLPGGRVYELWFRPGPDQAVRPAGTFQSDGGVVLATTRVGASFDVLAVSVEPEGGSPQPTTQPIFVAPV